MKKKWNQAQRMQLFLVFLWDLGGYNQEHAQIHQKHCLQGYSPHTQVHMGNEFNLTPCLWIWGKYDWAIKCFVNQVHINSSTQIPNHHTGMWPPDIWSWLYHWVEPNLEKHPSLPHRDTGWIRWLSAKPPNTELLRTDWRPRQQLSE